jgi:release factor glutamine methyltransferase
MRAGQPDPLTLRGLIREAERVFARGPHAGRAGLDAEMLLLLALKRIGPERNRAWLVANADLSASHDVKQEFDALIERRRRGEPIQYITGETEFYGLPFRVTSEVLIPRPETEHLVERAIELASHFPAPRIVDVGTGSGAIAVALAHELSSASVTAIDISAPALHLACSNAERNRLESRIRFLHGHLLDPLDDERFDIVVSNPPYVAAADRQSLAIEVRDYEPAQALFAGEDGLDVIREVIPAAFAGLVPGGFLLMEFGDGQRPAVSALLGKAGFAQIEFVPDLQGIPRVACAMRP